MIARTLAALVLALGPAPAHACAVCLDSASGDRGFNLAFVAFLAMPFIVIAGLGAFLAWLGAGWTRPDPAARGEDKHRC